jgi:putative integral membrane protein (TIGR02587 family)
LAKSAPLTQNDEDESDPHGWRKEGRDLLRGVAGGIIFGLPLLYTMEMWWHGLILSEGHLLGLLGAILVINFLFSYLYGFREECSPPEALAEAVTSVGIGILVSTSILWLIGELDQDLALAEMLGKILIESVAVSIGVSLAKAHIHPDSGENPADEDEEGDPERKQLRADLRDLGATLAGATILAFSIAPTEEIIQIASRLSPLRQLVLFGGELLLCYLILFLSGFKTHEVYVKDSVVQRPWAETVMACALSLLLALGMNLLLGQREIVGHPSMLLSATLALGLPAIIGGAAGRLIA